MAGPQAIRFLPLKILNKSSSAPANYYVGNCRYEDNNLLIRFLGVFTMVVDQLVIFIDSELISRKINIIFLPHNFFVRF